MATTTKEESWVKQYWRPLMAYQYFWVCLFDFFLAPVGTAILSAMFTGIPYVPWVPITLQQGGFYHLAMGAIIGVTSWTRGKEKITRVELNK
jgi:hypothetical protein